MLAALWDKRLRGWAMLLLALAVALMFQGSRSLWDPDEGRYSNVALEMVDSGDYLTPRRNDEALHVSKPPITYWLMAGSVNAFGRSEWALRLPMALAFALTVGLVFSLGRVFTPARPWLPALVYLTLPLPFLAATTITTDTILTCVETAAVLAYVRLRWADGSPRWLDAMWALFGLAFMVKGPPALLPLLAIAAFELQRQSLPTLLRPVGVSLFLLVALSWFAWMVNRHPELAGYWVGHEVVGRIASDQHDRHGQWYGGLMIYLPTLVVGSLPWGVLALGSRWSRVSAPPMPANSRFLWLWLCMPLACFLLVRSRLPFYLLPLFVPLSLLVAQALAGVAFGRNKALLVGCWLVLMVMAKLLASHASSGQDARRMADELRQLLPQPPRELLFVETKARYGLRFYLGAEIERISLLDSTSGESNVASAVDDSLRHELSESEPGVFFLVPTKTSAIFSSRVSSAGFQAVPLGKVHDLQVFAVESSR